MNNSCLLTKHWPNITRQALEWNPQGGGKEDHPKPRSMEGSSDGPIFLMKCKGKLMMID